MATMPMVGDEFAGYRLLAVLGRGGMSVVYQAENPRLGSVVAMKILASDIAGDDVFRARFLQESRIAASLNHPNVIPILDMGSHNDLLYIAMRYVAGQDLRNLIRAHRRLTPTESLYAVTQTGRALDFAHGHGLIHRDVKPANVLVERGADDDDPDHVYLADFGITKHALSRSGLTPTGQFMGTLDYVAPEQIQGRGVDARSDLYSLGCVLYECLTGQVPFVKDVDAAVLWAHVEESPPPPSSLRSGLPAAIDDVMEQALAKRPADRYPDCRTMMAEARKALGNPDLSRARLLSRGGEAPPAHAQRPGAPGQPGAARDAWGVEVDQGAGLATTAGRPGGPRPPHQRDGAAATGPRSDPEPVPGAAEPVGHLDGSAAGRGRRRDGTRRAWSAAAAVVVVVLAVASGAWLVTRHHSVATPVGGAARSTSSNTMAMSPSGTRSRTGPAAGDSPMMTAIARANTNSNGRLPTRTCRPHGEHQHVRCVHPYEGVETADFLTYDSLRALYGEYKKKVAQLSGRPFTARRSNRGECNRFHTSGELSWNHNFEHPQTYSLAEVAAGRLSDDQAAGRVFCTVTSGRLVMVWTENDGRLLGQISGTPFSHPATYKWWRQVHHVLGVMDMAP